MNFGDCFSCFRSQILAGASSKSRSHSSLPDDILIEIFAYLPLNSIYKLRCLSKVWLSNLSEPNFITKWFQINEKSLPWIHYHSLAVYGPFANPVNRLTFRNRYPESHSDFMFRNEHLFSFEFLMNQKPFQGARLYLHGSSNGLVLCYSFGSDGQIRYHVCNPLTKTWVSIPSPPLSEASDVSVRCIFCEYSSSFRSRYKVVRIAEFHEPSKKFVVDVFCSDLGVWGSFQVSCDENVVWGSSNNPNNAVILNGVLYWIEGGNRMLVYNLNGSDRHRCSLIHLPDEENVFDSILGESEGCVCYAITRITGWEMTVSVWVLDEVNWEILHNDISAGDLLAEWRSLIGFKRIQILGFSPLDRNVVLLGCHDWVRGFNIQTGSFEELRFDNRFVYYTGGMHLPFALKPMPTVLPLPSWMNTLK